MTSEQKRQIRRTIDDWAGHYAAHSGHSIDRAYLASLANDIALEISLTAEKRGPA